MNILLDENMPYAHQLFGRLGAVRSLPGRRINAAALDQTDALMVRSVTPVTASLLANSAIRFVGSATAGTDHVDEAWLLQAGIGFSAAPGCNALAVVEYVISALLSLGQRDDFLLKDRTVGIIGVGNVGSRLNQRLSALGVRTLLCDPLRADRGDEGDFADLATLVREADVLTFHTPLTDQGAYRTRHLVDEALLACLPDNAILINACRGPVVDNAALLRVLQTGKPLSVVLDVWEPEPDLSLPLLSRVSLATPHIAGYSLEGKARGTTQVYDAFSRFIGVNDPVALDSLLPPPAVASVAIRGELDESMLRQLVHLVYDVRRDDGMLRRAAAAAGEFDRLRRDYPVRREWSSLRVETENAASAALLAELGFNAGLAPSR